MRPAIGLTCEFDLETDCDPPRERSSVLAAYTDAVLAAGGLPQPIAVPPRADAALLDEILDRLDGIVFTGGPDLHSRHYDEPLHPEAHVMHARREALDLPLFRRADERGIPILAICLGFQIAHVARGGKIVQHVDDLKTPVALAHHQPRGRSAFHPVEVAGDSRLADVVGATRFEANSRHHQGADTGNQGRGLRPVAHAPDGLLEASEDCTDGRFLLAVQWHPENLIDRPEHLRLFTALVDEARQFRARRK